MFLKSYFWDPFILSYISHMCDGVLRRTDSEAYSFYFLCLSIIRNYQKFTNNIAVLTHKLKYTGYDFKITCIKWVIIVKAIKFCYLYRETI